MNKDLLDLICRDFNEDIEEQVNRLDYACRYIIPHRIRGVITKGKIKYRGLYVERQSDAPFPILCGKESRSGKRKSFRVDLNFDGYDLLEYEFLRDFEKSYIRSLVGYGFNYCKGDMWEVGGIANLITKNNE